MIGSKKLVKDYSVVVNGIDYIGDADYIYEIINYENIIVALPVSKFSTPHDLSSLKCFETTLNALYYLKANLIKLSDEVKTGKSREVLNYELVDIFNIIGEGENDDEDSNENQSLLWTQS